MYRTLNPATGALIREYPTHTDEELESRLKFSEKTFFEWSRTSVGQRLDRIKALEEVLLREKERLALIMTEEMGKPLSQAVIEIEKCAKGCRYYSAHGEALLREESVSLGQGQHFVRHDPLGMILGIMPWNFPFWQVIRFAVPALLAGNVVLLKHAPNVPASALALQSIFEEAGFIKGVFQALFLENETTEKLVQDSRVAAISLTGSARAGKRVAALAGASLKKTVLELGGADPFIVFGDADFDLCVATAIRSRFLNTGQSCIAAKRMIVQDSVADRFVEALQMEILKLKIGDPLAKDTFLGPLARFDLRDALVQQVDLSVKKGAQWVVAGGVIEGPGAFYKPGLLTGVASGMPAFDEELFGPVAVVLVVKNEEEAVRVANNTNYGLGASLWTRDRERIMRMVPQLQAGSVFVNTMVKSTPELPFGGVKNSGYGRELSGYGLKEFCNIKTVGIL